MYYSDEIVEEVRTRNDIVGVISQVVNLKKKGGRYFGICPFHNEKTPSFSVSQENQMYYCFGCGAGGNVMTFVMQYENYTFPEAMEYLAERAGIELPKEEPTAAQKREADIRSQILAVNKAAATFYYYQLRQPSGARAKEYFTKRGLSEETMQKFGLGYSPQTGSPLYRYLRNKGFSDELLSESQLIRFSERGPRDSFWNRAMFPIMDVHNRVIGFGGRVMGEGEPKYLNSPETKVFDKSRNLYGLNIARSSRRPYMLLCEGYMDVISLHQAGFDCAVASLGTAFTSGHASLLKRYTGEVIITYDSDGAGQRAALRAIPILKQAGLTVKVLDMKPYKDPDEFIQALGAEAYQERIDRAVNSFLFECDTLQAAADMADPESKTAFHREVAAKLAEFTDTLERENYLTSVSARYSIQPAALREMVNYIGGRQVKGNNDEEATLPKREAVKNEKARALREAERLVLNWCAKSPMPFSEIINYVLPEYFTDELNREVADTIFESLALGQSVSPAAIMTRYIDDEEKRDKVAAIFNTEIPEDEDADVILTENIKLLKRDDISRRLRNSADPREIQQIAQEKLELDRAGIWHFPKD